MIDVLDNKDYQIQVTEDEGHLFLHLDIYNWGVQAAKSLKQDVNRMREIGRAEGHELIFAFTEDEKIIKLWNRCAPCYDIEPVEGGYVGAWDTGGN